MTTRTPSEPITSSGVKESPWANGLTIFAAVIMVIAGFWQALAGIAALAHDNVYVTTPQYICSTSPGGAGSTCCWESSSSAPGSRSSWARCGHAWSGSCWLA